MLFGLQELGDICQKVQGTRFGLCFEANAVDFEDELEWVILSGVFELV